MEGRGEPSPPVGPLPPGDAPPTRRATGPVPPPGAVRTGPPAPRSAAPGGANLNSTLYLGIGLAGAVTFFFALGWLGYYNISFIFEHLSSGYSPLILSLEFTTFSFLIGIGFAFGLGLV